MLVEVLEARPREPDALLEVLTTRLRGALGVAAAEAPPPPRWLPYASVALGRGLSAERGRTPSGPARGWRGARWGAARGGCFVLAAPPPGEAAAPPDLEVALWGERAPGLPPRPLGRVSLPLRWLEAQSAAMAGGAAPGGGTDIGPARWFPLSGGGSVRLRLWSGPRRRAGAAARALLLPGAAGGVEEQPGLPPAKSRGPFWTPRPTGGGAWREPPVARLRVALREARGLAVPGRSRRVPSPFVKIQFARWNPKRGGGRVGRARLKGLRAALKRKTPPAKATAAPKGKVAVSLAVPAVLTPAALPGEREGGAPLPPAGDPSRRGALKLKVLDYNPLRRQLRGAYQVLGRASVGLETVPAVALQAPERPPEASWVPLGGGVADPPRRARWRGRAGAPKTPRRPGAGPEPQTGPAGPPELKLSAWVEAPDPRDGGALGAMAAAADPAAAAEAGALSTGRLGVRVRRFRLPGAEVRSRDADGGGQGPPLAVSALVRFGPDWLASAPMLRRGGAKAAGRGGGGALLEKEPATYDVLYGAWRLAWEVPEPASEVTLAVFECADEKSSRRSGGRDGQPTVELRQCVGVARVRVSTLPGRWRGYLLPLQPPGVAGPGRGPPAGQLEVELRFERGGAGAMARAYTQPRAPLRDFCALSTEFKAAAREREAAARQQQALVAHGLDAVAGGPLHLPREGAEDVLGVRAQRFSVKRMRAAVDRARESVTGPRGVARAFARWHYNPATWKSPPKSAAIAGLGLLALEHAEIVLPLALLLVAVLGVAARFVAARAVAAHLSASHLEDLARLEGEESARRAAGPGGAGAPFFLIGAGRSLSLAPGLGARTWSARGASHRLGASQRGGPEQQPGAAPALARPLAAPIEAVGFRVLGLAARGTVAAARGIVGAVGLGTRAVGATALGAAEVAGQAAKGTAERLGQKVAKVRRKAAVLVCLTKYRELQRQYGQLLEQASGAQARVNATARRLEQLQSVFLWVDPVGSLCVFLCFALSSLFMLLFGLRRAAQLVFLFYLRPPSWRRPVPNVLGAAMSRIPPWCESADIKCVYAARGVFEAEGEGGGKSAPEH